MDCVVIVRPEINDRELLSQWHYADQLQRGGQIPGHGVASDRLVHRERNAIA